MPLSLVRATYDFQSSESGDLSFRADDIIEVVRWVNDQWIYGRFGPDEGMFPSNFVEKLALPQYKPPECILVVTKNFSKEESSDLDIKRGQVVVGLRPENSDWWFGRGPGGEGIFPDSHVRRVPAGSGGASLASSSRNLPKPVRARAICDLKGQIDGELSFNEGDFLEVKIQFFLALSCTGQDWANCVTSNIVKCLCQLHWRRKFKKK